MKDQVLIFIYQLKWNFVIPLFIRETKRNIFSSPTAIQNPQPLEFNKKTIQDFQDNPDFDYSQDSADSNWWNDLKEYLSRKWKDLIDLLFGDLEDTPFISVLVDLLPYLLLAILIGLLWHYLSANTKRHRQSFKEELSEEAKIVQSRNIRKLIEEAKEQKDFRLAIRYHFLEVLQQLTRKNLIRYNQFKTDEDYQKEIQDQKIRKKFIRTRRIYSFTWFGQFDVVEERYQVLQQEFEDCIKMIQSP